MKRKLLSVLLTLAMALTLLPVSAMAEGETGTLQSQIATSGTVTLDKDYTEDITIPSGADVTLDLNGKTLSNTNNGKATLSVEGTAVVKNGTIIGGTGYYNIEVKKGGSLTLENVTATAGNTGSSMIDNWGTLTIKSGDYSGGLDVVKSEPGATLLITGGTFALNHAVAWSYTGVVLSYGDLTITGGTFNQNATTPAKAYPTVVVTAKDKVDDPTPHTKITGGVFNNAHSSSSAKIFHPMSKATSDNFEVSGGTFNKSISDGYCADGFIPTKNADGTYGVKEGKYVAQIGSKKYETLADAIRLAAKGKTVTLLADVTENVTIKAAKDMILNLNGHTLSGGTTAGKAALTNYGKLTINDSSKAQTGTIKREDENTSGYYVIDNKGTMTINGGNVINDSSKNGSSLIRNGGAEDDNAYPTLNITGGTFTQQNFIAIKNDALSRLNVSGGKITSNASAIQNWYEATITGGEINGQLWTDAFAWPGGESTGNTTISENAKFNGEIVMDITGKNVVPKLNISGGDLNITNWRITPAASAVGAKPAVSGGTFSSEVKPEYCAPGFVPKDNGDGTFGVQEYKPIEVWTDYSGSTGSKVESYTNLADAAKNLGNYQWILVANNYTLNENFAIPKDVRLDIKSGATLTVAEGATLTVAADAKRLAVLTGGSIVNNGTIMVCGTSYASGSVMVQDNANIDLEKLTVPNGYILGKNGNKYYAAKALFEVTFSDGSTKQLGELADLAGATKVTLLADVTDFNGYGFTKLDGLAENFVLDLGGHTLSGKNTATADVLSTSVPMTITNGTVKFTGPATENAGALKTSADVTIAKNAVIDGGDGYGIYTEGYGHTLTVNGKVQSNGAYAITGNGSDESSTGTKIDVANCNITVNAGAVISAPNGVAIYHPEKGTVTINGGEITGHTGIEMCAGKLVVKDGTITSTGADDSNSDNVVLNGAAISILDRSYPGGSPSAEITGGAFTSATAPAIRAYHWEYPNATDWTDAGTKVNISGGTFSSIPDNMNALCAAGYIPFKNADGTYGVTRPSSGSSGSYDPTYSVSTPSKTENGSVTVSPKSASKGDTVTVTVKPDSGYVLETLTVTDKNGNELTLKDKGNGKYTFTMPAGKVEVKATFMEDNSMLNFFYDVPNNAYFYEAVKWAVENGITTGVGNDLFAPEQPCTRAQIVTFLWRAAGSPEPKGAASGMTDVVSGSYYEKAVAWAIENGITTGTTTSTFSPDATCTRAQAVTFLARALSAKASGKAEFSDVPADSYFADAVAWAAANGVTEGIGGGLFGSDNDCTRGQIVTFLYRAYNK